MKKHRIKRRRQLLPWWMKVSAWIFMILGLSSLATRFVQIMGITIFGSATQKSIYGLATYEQFSLLSLTITTLILFKAFTGFILWTEKKYAIKFCIIDAFIGIAICIVVMFIMPIFTLGNDVYDFNRRFELLFLLPYAVHLINLRKKWGKFTKVIPVDLFVKENENHNPNKEKMLFEEEKNH